MQSLPPAAPSHKAGLQLQLSCRHVRFSHICKRNNSVGKNQACFIVAKFVLSHGIKRKQLQHFSHFKWGRNPSFNQCIKEAAPKLAHILQVRISAAALLTIHWNYQAPGALQNSILTHFKENLHWQRRKPVQVSTILQRKKKKKANESNWQNTQFCIQQIQFFFFMLVLESGMFEYTSFIPLISPK